ncbi:MAG TPA: acetylxylan esterase [Tepidisphaeraceae bacterium]|nr:acetylxylan esterase [Tepidisphaeraceae bacterium]
MMNVKQRREELYGLMGDLPVRDRKISVKKISEEERDGYRLENLVLDLNGVEEVPAYFVSPLSRQAAKIPAVLYNHAHGGDYALGKDELLKSRKLLFAKPYAKELTEMGFAALCIDHWAFGERATRKETEIFKDMLWHGRVMWGMMVYDTLRALDYLVSREDVDASRIATLGLSMGSTMAWWAAAIDERIKVCVDICCLTDYDALIANKSLDAHGVYYYVPSLLKHFTAGQINALIAPRPHLGLAGNLDRLTPPEGLDRIDAELKQVYGEAGHPEAWKLLRWDVPHQEIPEMRAEIVKFLQRWV